MNRLNLRISILPGRNATCNLHTAMLTLHIILLGIGDDDHLGTQHQEPIYFLQE